MNKFLNKREINKRIVAVPVHRDGKLDGYWIRHDIADEAIVCEVPTLEIAGCIVKALRERQHIVLAGHLLAKHMKKGKGK